MKADAAAAKLELVNPGVAAAILMQLPPRQSSLILSEMSNEKAAVVTNVISSATDPGHIEGTVMRYPISVLLAASLLSGCQNQTFNEIGRAPAMSPIGSGLQYAQTPQMAMYPKEPRQVMNGYSLWSDNQSALFKDARALKVGDILTVDIRIDDKASFDNKTDRSRTNRQRFENRSQW
jgi:hypothetical protein